MLVENRRMNEDLAELLALAEFLAAHDPLTGPFNRRALFEGDLTAMAGNSQMHMLLIDLDHFKSLNDSYGHEIGDRALVLTSNSIRDALRGHGDGSHFAVRLGGEEFEERVALFAEDLCQAIAALHDPLELPRGATSASIGLTQHQKGASLDRTMRCADEAMYRAKAGGRNRVRRTDRVDR